MKTLKYLALYTFLFVFLYIGCFGIYFYIEGTEGINFMDTLNLQYQTFVYLGDYLRFILTHGTVPLWDYTMGYGSDILPTIASHLYDPFCWLSAFFEGASSEYAYQAMIILKLYVSGLAFSIFCFYRRHKWPYVLAGALTYTFSGTTYIVFTQMFFINPLYLFPLLILSVDRIFNEKKYGFYVLMLTWCFINYFYMAYMMCLLAGFYIIALSLDDWFKTRQTKDVLIKLLKIGFFSIIALGLSAIVLWPLLDVLTSQNRLDAPYVVKISQSFSYYYKIAVNFILPFYCGADCYIGLGIIALPCLVILFIKRGNKRLKAEFIFLTIGFCLPVFGYMMNGFVYSANRWIFGYEFLVAYIVVAVLPLFQKKDWKKIVYVLIFYSVLGMFLGFCGQIYFTVLVLNFFIMFVLATFFAYALCDFSEQRKVPKMAGILILSCVSALLPYYISYISYSNYIVGKMMPVHTAYQKLMESAGLPLVKKIIQNEPVRYNHNFNVYILPHENSLTANAIANASWIAKVMGTDFYRNIYNNQIEIFHDKILLLRDPFAGSYHHLNGRTELLALFGVKYYVESDDKAEMVPPHYGIVAGKERIGEVDYTVYQSISDVSLVYGFERAISLDDFEKGNSFLILTEKILMKG